MWARNQWNQIPLDAAAYQNMNHELVDWASLAQQWIRMKEVHETVVLNVPQITQSHFPSNTNLLTPQTVMGVQPSDSVITSGEAPMDVEKEDESTPSSSDWCWQSQTANQMTPNWPQLQQGSYATRPVFPQTFHPGVATPLSFPPRVPLLPLPSARPISSDEDSLGATSFSSVPTLDASKRKNLPAWIREGLEKMEKEKLKKEEREKFLFERELKRKKELEMRSDGDMSVTRSRFDDSEEGEDEEDDSVETIVQPATSKQHSKAAIVPNTQSLEDMMVRIRQFMTEILLEVTTEEIRAAALEASRAKVKTRQAQSPLSSKSLTQKLGLDQYGSDSDGETSDQESTRTHQISGDSGANSFDVHNYEKQPQDEESRVERNLRAFQVEKGLVPIEKFTHSKEFEENQNKGGILSILQDGTKVETDITSKFPHGQDQPASLFTTQDEDSIVKSRETSDGKSEINVGGEWLKSSRSQDKRSRTPDKRKRSRSKERRYSSRRSDERSKSRRRSRSRERKRSRSRRRSRSRDRRRSASRRRSRSFERKASSRKGRERDRSRDRRK